MAREGQGYPCYQRDDDDDDDDDISFQDMQSFFKVLVSVINHYYINGLHLF